jgi:hypothetical protein
VASQKDNGALNAIKLENAVKGGEANKARLEAVQMNKPPLVEEDPYAYLDGNLDKGEMKEAFYKRPKSKTLKERLKHSRQQSYDGKHRKIAP